MSLHAPWQTITAPLTLAGDADLTLQHDAPADAVRVARLAVLPARGN